MISPTFIREKLTRAIKHADRNLFKWRICRWAKGQRVPFRGKRSILTDRQASEIMDLYRPYFRPDLRFHQFYTEATGEYHPEIIPDDVYYTVIDRYFNNWEKAYYFDDKCYYDRLLGSMDFEMPTTVCYRINGMWLSSDYTPLTIQEVLKVIRKNPQAFLKQSIDSEGGHGVKFIKDTSTYSLQSILEELGPDIIVQLPIEQSPALSRLHEASINTVRVLSLLMPDGSVKICSAILRIGVNGSKVDNASSGGISCGIMPDGHLKHKAFNIKGECFDKHPSTGVAFDSVVVPGFNEICRKIKKAHPQLPNFRLLSWDIAIDGNDRPVLLEINMRIGEIDFHQLNNGPVFGSDTKKILNEVFHKS